MPNLKIDKCILSKIITVVYYYSHYVLHCIICFNTFSRFSQQTSNKSFISIPILQKVQTTYLIEAIDLKAVEQGMSTYPLTTQSMNLTTLRCYFSIPHQPYLDEW